MSDSWSVERTADGSQTLYSSKFDAHYHSMHGALQESKHVFLLKGLTYWLNAQEAASQDLAHASLSQHKVQTQDDISAAPSSRHQPRILEYGMGTALNVILTQLYAEEHKVRIDYHSIEGYPVPSDVYQGLDYFDGLHKESFQSLHTLKWDTNHQLSPYFDFHKEHVTFEDFKTTMTFDIIYFDAFGPRCQPHLWKEEILQVAYDILNKGGILVTFCAQGAFKRALRAVGFEVERVPGPPGKREMTRAKRV